MKITVKAVCEASDKVTVAKIRKWAEEAGGQLGQFENTYRYNGTRHGQKVGDIAKLYGADGSVVGYVDRTNHLVYNGKSPIWAMGVGTEFWGFTGDEFPAEGKGVTADVIAGLVSA